MHPVLRSVRPWLPVVGAFGLALLLAGFDFLEPTGRWYADHPMTGAAIAGILLFVQAAFLLETWMREREAHRLERISTVAYRSLAQYANDAGRSLLAPLNGADLYSLAVPGATAETVEASTARLREHGFEPVFEEATGSWGNCNRTELSARLMVMCADRGFVREMFRTTALQRRRLQEATALWAPVMLTSKATTNDLSRYRELTDALEMLQERWRLSGWIAHSDATPSPGWLAGVDNEFWGAVSAYESVRDEFAVLAGLPSDSIVRRRSARVLQPASQ